MMKIGINGFGRIGRILVKQLLELEDIEIVFINDLMDKKQALYLFRYDSAHGVCSKGIDSIKYSSFSSIELIDCNGADIVVDCTAQNLNINSLKKYSAKKVILAAMPNDNLPVIVYGINENNYKNQKIISAGSCTTNSLATILQLFSQDEIICGVVTSVHSTTTDQRLLDGRTNSCEIRKSRASMSSIIPINSGVAFNLDKIMPIYKNRFSGQAYRVPINNVCLLDIVLKLKYKINKREILKRYAKIAPYTLLLDEEKRVSRDFNTHKSAAILIEDLIDSNQNLLKLVAWHDNEWGYTRGVIDLIKYIKKETNEFANN